MFHNFSDFIKIGGVPVYFLMGLAAFAVAIIWERAQALFFLYGADAPKFLQTMKTYIVADKIEEAIAYCSQQGKALLPRITKMILERADRDDESLHTVHDLASMEIIPLVTKRLGYLAMIANVATLIGLLGTIHGLIESFQAVSFADPAQKQTLLAQGISLAMNTTALGLMLAIPVMVIFSIFQSRQNKLIEEMVSVSAKVVDLLVSRSYQVFDEQVAYPSHENGVPPAAPKTSTGKRKVA